VVKFPSSVAIAINVPDIDRFPTVAFVNLPPTVPCVAFMSVVLRSFVLRNVSCW
jgi:hypothetical protein